MTDLRNKLIRPAAWAFYVILVFEILFMVSPAALFFYSVCGPVLEFLNDASATAWLTQFFLPHIATTGDPVLDHTRLAGALLFVLGLIVFLAGAVPLYWSKIRRHTGIGRNGQRARAAPDKADAAVRLRAAVAARHILGRAIPWQRLIVHEQTKGTECSEMDDRPCLFANSGPDR